MPIQIDTDNTIYICTDAQNGTVTVLVPQKSPLMIEHLKLDDPDPYGPYAQDKAKMEYCQELGAYVVDVNTSRAVYHSVTNDQSVTVVVRQGRWTGHKYLPHIQ